MTNPSIRTLQENDLQRITCVHLAAFPKSTLGLLGARVVAKYYQWQLQGPHDAVALGIFHQQSLVGFCFAGIFRGALSGFLQKNKLFLAQQVLTHPSLIVTPFFREHLNLVWGVLSPQPPRIVAQPLVPVKSFGILAIAIDPKIQRTGLGKQLMLETERVAVERDFEHLHLTVSTDNFQAIAFYEKLGWQKSMASDGVWHGVMVKNLGNAHE
jgi:ribosomal protein S18 acetylase RimI-like enzyme